MERVIIIPEEEFDLLVKDLTLLKKRVENLEKGLAEYVGTAEAMRMTGLSRTSLYGIRKTGRVEWKGEGSKVLYLRSSLEELNEGGRVRRRR